MEATGIHQNEHEFWMRRCLELAVKGRGMVSPNPMVGAVLVRDGVVLAEGWHAVYGGPHAERMLFERLEAGVDGVSGDGSVGASGSGEEMERDGEMELGVNLEAARQYNNFSDCILYVSLEPCAHFGKTPPCANLILEKGVGRVVVGVLDPNPLVSGKGVALLRAAGVEVLVGVLEAECRGVNRMFWVNQVFGRTAVIAKWAETVDGYMGSGSEQRVMISGPEANAWVHGLRAGVDAILVGVNTWNLDRPKLTVRGIEGSKQPIRIVLDRTGKGQYTQEALRRSNGELWVVGGELDLAELLKWLYREKGLGVILVEGGAEILESFWRSDCVDEVHLLRNLESVLGGGVKSPRMENLVLRRLSDLGGDAHWVWERDFGR